MPDKDRRSLLNIAAALGPVALAVGLLVVYLVAPEFYLAHILREDAREYQFVEIVTFGSSAVASAILLWCTSRFWKERIVGATILVGTLFAATLFFAGEEVSWGQTWFGWDTPESFESFSHETNIHNSGLPVRTLAPVFLASYFFVFPAIWSLRHKVRLPADWSPAVPEAPAIFAMAFAFGWKQIKNVYRLLSPDANQSEPGIYRDYIEQLNEQMEMLAAVAILIYALSLLRTVRRLRSAS
ncbi:MAG: hypothetical protein AAFX05_03900 [Planctomycetota bacterium]